MALPPSVFLAALSLGGIPPLRLQLDYANWLVTFAMPLATAALATALYGQLKGRFKSLKVTADAMDGSRLLGPLTTPTAMPTPSSGRAIRRRSTGLPTAESVTTFFSVCVRVCWFVGYLYKG